MKVIHINNSDVGGAARACVRLHKALIEQGVDSRIYVGKVLNDTEKTFSVTSKLKKINLVLSPFLDYLPKVFYKSKNSNFHSYDFWPTDLIDDVIKEKPDIVHIHWIGGGLLRLEELEKIKCPIVWTLHDMWTMTGGEHVVTDTFRMKQGYLVNNRPRGEVGFDVNRWMWKRKNRLFKKLGNVTFVAPSTYMSNLAKHSAQLKKSNIEIIPNCLDKKIFRKIDKKVARNILNLEKNKKYILFGAYGPTKDLNKGLDLLIKSLETIQRKGVELLIFGTSNLDLKLNISVKCLGVINDEMTLSLLYNASDVTVVPSRIESFGQVAMESLACGTPVVCFDTSGLKDIVVHNKNGYRAKIDNTKDLWRGIEKYISESTDIPEDKRFADTLVVKKFVNLYKYISSLR